MSIVQNKKDEMMNNGTKETATHAAKSETGNYKAIRRSNVLAGGLLFMADDFDETPEGFEEYSV